jgi:hypothetical protein
MRHWRQARTCRFIVGIVVSRHFRGGWELFGGHVAVTMLFWASKWRRLADEYAAKTFVGR